MSGKKAIDVIEEEICYSVFYEEYLVKNRPCLFSKLFTASWPCRKSWVKDGRPNWDYLEANYGHLETPVANCDEAYFNAHSKSTWSITDYVDHLKKYKENSSSMPCLYLKDWHFVQNTPHIEPVYETPIYFAVDWLNEQWILKGKDDYRFVYIGPKGSWTPLHADVYGSFSWSANIVGKKKWIFFPPGEEQKLKIAFDLPSLPHDISPFDLSSTLITYIELIQNEGEIIFVPSKWFHQVWNLEDTISINHNWFNGANVGQIFDSLKVALDEIKTEFSEFGIHDIEKDHLETVLSAHHGMNVQQFRELLETVVKRRESGFLRIHSSQSCRVCSSICDDQLHREEDRKIALEMLTLIDAI